MDNQIICLNKEAHILRAEVTKSTNGATGSVDLIYENCWKRIR